MSETLFEAEFVASADDIYTPIGQVIAVEGTTVLYRNLGNVVGWTTATFPRQIAIEEGTGGEFVQVEVDRLVKWVTPDKLTNNS